jgi:hypothetical protein
MYGLRNRRGAMLWVRYNGNVSEGNAAIKVSIKDKGGRKLRNKSHFLVPEAFRILSHL